MSGNFLLELNPNKLQPQIQPEGKQNMLTLIVTTAVLALLYGLAWHNAPAKERHNEHRSDQS